MKPAPDCSDLSRLEPLDRSVVQGILDDASRAAEPDYFIQKATGRVLTKLLLVVGGIQVLGVLFWLVLVFSGVVDATMNLDGFMISQLVVFLLSVFVGLAIAIRHIRALRAKAEAMEPNLVVPLLDHVDSALEVETRPQTDPPDGIDDVGDARWLATSNDGDTSCRLGEWSRTPSSGSVVVARASRSTRGNRGAFVLGDAPAVIEDESWSQVAVAGPGDSIEVYAGDETPDAKALWSGAGSKSLEQFFDAAAENQPRDEKETDDDGAAVIIDGESVTVVDIRSSPLLPVGDEVVDTTIDDAMEAAEAIASALQICRHFQRR